MKIGIVLHPYNEKKPAGLGGYIFNLTKALIEGDTDNEYVVFLKEKPLHLPDIAGDNWRVQILGFGPLWRDIGFFFAPKVDVCIFNTPILPLIFKHKRSIAIALDFAYWHLGAKTVKEKLMRYTLFLYNKISLLRADTIVAISNATKKDTIELFKISEKKIHTIYPGFRNICALPEEKIDIGTSDPFFLFAGVIKGRKNVFNIVKAFISFKQKYNTAHKLVIAGSGGGEYLDMIKKMLSREKMEDEVIFAGYVSNKQLVYLYKHAQVFVFPSIIEGFGFPLLEAMSCGLPVITSNVSSLGEIAADAAITIDPNDTNALAESFYGILDGNKREFLIEKGHKRAREFSWQNTAQLFKRLF